MKLAKCYIFLKNVIPGVVVDISLQDPQLKHLCFYHKENKVMISLHIDGKMCNLFYVCYANSNYVVDGGGDIPKEQAYDAVTAIVNDFFEGK